MKVLISNPSRDHKPVLLVTLTLSKLIIKFLAVMMHCTCGHVWPNDFSASLHYSLVCLESVPRTVFAITM